MPDRPLMGRHTNRDRTCCHLPLVYPPFDYFAARRNASKTVKSGRLPVVQQYENYRPQAVCRQQKYSLHRKLTLITSLIKKSSQEDSMPIGVDKRGTVGFLKRIDQPFPFFARISYRSRVI
ncbi:MAG: hypothetical protein H0U23_07065 [Blastocatellia bacterium]|nr:hypothetical protein [Blastocatellia bacterium]